MKKHLTLLGVAAVATAVLAGCSNDELVESYQGEEISFRTRVETRATETTLGNLKDFKVWGDAEGASTFFLTEGIATKDEDPSHTNIYNLTTKEGNKVYWPSGVERIDFWAYAPSDINITPTINMTTQQLNNYTPDASATDGGKNHKDLIVAYTQANKTGHGTSIGLSFKHALSNISLKLKSGDKTKMMRLKGAWFVNIKKNGSIILQKNADNPIQWNTNDETAFYGMTFSNIQEVTHIASSAIIDRTSQSTDLMLVPQETSQLALNSDGDVTTNGSYILLFCQILQVHPGAIHTDGTQTTAADEQHYHQLFPENDKVIESGANFTEEFGYTCVPVTIDWQSGKKYTYTLEFCGKTSGGGIYPPDDLPDGLPTGNVQRPNGKKPGDTVLDSPISFTVNVGNWEDATSEDYTGDIPMK